MEPLSVKCTTCGSRLKIRDPRLIGQIVACPKCKGMVLVDNQSSQLMTPNQASLSNKTAPTVGVAFGQDDVDSEAMTQEKIDTTGWTAISSTDSPPDSAHAPQGHGASFAFDEPEQVAGSVSSQPVSSSPISSRAADRTTVMPPDFPDGGPAPAEDGIPPIAWQSESSAKIRQYAAVTVVGLIGLLVAGGAFMFVVRQWSDSRAQQALAKADADTLQDASGLTPAAPPQNVEAEHPKPQDPGSAEVGDASAELSDADHDDQGDGGDIVTTSNPPADHGSAAGADQPAPSAPESNAGQTPDALFPEVVIGSGAAGKTGGSQADSETTAETLPPSLAQYMKVIVEGKPDAIIPASIEPAPQGIDQLKIQFPQLAIPDTEFPPPAPPVDVRARGKMRILGLRAEDQPLDHLLRVVSQAAGIPVQLELISFDVVGRPINSPVTIRAKETEAASLLSMIAQNAGCGLRLGDDGIVSVLPGEAEITAAVSKALDLTDFGGNFPVDDSLLKRLMGVQPETVIKLQGDRLTVEGDTSGLLQAALAVEAIRLLRGLDPKLATERTGRWIRVLIDHGAENNSALVDWSPIPDHPVGFNEDREYGLELVLGDLAADAGTALVLDWRSCWTHGLTPEAKALPWYQGKMTHAIFEQVLRPYGLVHYKAGADIIWVGTQETYENMNLWAVLAEGSSPATAVQRIAAATGTTVEQTAVWHDTSGGKILAYLPRYVLRQLPNLLAETKTP